MLVAKIEDRVAASISDGPGVTGWLLTPLCGYFAAAAVASRVAGLDLERNRRAIRFAYVQASGNGQSTRDGAQAKRMQPGFLARHGVLAAELAARGLPGW
jgi:2-methylcitrate dehydratase PrpD